MRHLATVLTLAASLAEVATVNAQPGPLPLQRSGPYEVSLRLPDEGLYAGEEMQIEVRVADTRKPDPIAGFAPVIRATVRGVIDMPSMKGMPKIEELAHAEGIAGEYGLHATFLHGGPYRLRLEVQPPQEPRFPVEFPLEVKDADPKRKRVAPFRLEVTGRADDLTIRLYANRLTPERKYVESLVRDFDILHERPLHLIAIRRDQQVFRHVHPELQPDGSFRLRGSWPAGGEYLLFADFAPKGRGSQIVSAKLKVPGPAAAPVVASPLRIETGPLPKTGKTGQWTVRFSPAVPTEPYLGAAGHLMILSANGETLVHSHPIETEAAVAGQLTFALRLPQPGTYRAWLEVQSNGQVLTTSFQVTAQ